MRISGTEPSPVILSQTKLLKYLKSDAKSAQTSWSQGGWCKTHISSNSLNLKTDNFDALKRKKKNQKSRKRVPWLVSLGISYESTLYICHINS